MEPKILNPRPEFARPLFAPLPTSGYLYLAASVAPPSGPPLVRANPRRTALLARVKRLSQDLQQLPTVLQTTVYRAALLPPTGRGSRHPARYDIAVLIEVSSPEALDEVRAADPYQQMLQEIRAVATDVLEMPARCLRSIGPVDRTRPGLFLFNHFVADDAELAGALWEHLAGWYVAETGLDNSTLLAPIEGSDYVFVNHARWDKSLPRLALEQFAKKSFHTYVRANLKANHVVAMPILYRLA